MELLRPASIAEFIDLGGPFLSANEAQHGVMLGVAIATQNPAPNAYWALVVDNGFVVGAALRTSTRLILSRENAAGAMALLAVDTRDHAFHAVLGPTESVESFIIGSERPWRDVMSQRIYDCREVQMPRTVEGGHRLARAEDRGFLAAWVQQLSLEALHESVTLESAAARADDHVERGSMYVWEVAGSAVSAAAAVAPTPHGIRVNNVYTPPEHRRRGYASALVATLTQSLLDSGRMFVFLHTDLANATSNDLYVRIGYRPVADMRVVEPESRQKSDVAGVARFA
ncbi:MAG TPA: GNAT family N-acetyltransferase [Gemmatimonadaceae bacterium]|nr:GNAT family N-acetyltransferase [Gemmatimonadaceae bacterium]